MSLLYSYSEDNPECYIWEYNELGVKSRFYIHKWRTPTPVPAVIDVSFNFKEDFIPEKVIKECEFEVNFTIC